MTRDEVASRAALVDRSGELHPRHVPGHHAVVLARDGVRASGNTPE